MTDLLILEQDKLSDIEQQPPSGDRKLSNTPPQMRGGDTKVENQREYHIILTKYEVVHPTDVSENNSSLGMLMILIKQYILYIHRAAHDLSFTLYDDILIV